MDKLLSNLTIDNTITSITNNSNDSDIVQFIKTLKIIIPTIRNNYNKNSNIYHGEKIHLTISGLIGVGKTTFVKKFSQIKDCKIFEESVENNPYLDKFYENPTRYAFETQIHFLSQRLLDYNNSIDIQLNEPVCIFDRHLIEDYVFAKTCFKQKYLTQLQFNTYKQLFDELINNIKKPDLFIFLKATPETCYERINKRKRISENGIKLEYLKTLAEAYDEFIEEYNGKFFIIILNWENFVEFDFIFNMLTSLLVSNKNVV